MLSVHIKFMLTDGQRDRYMDKAWVKQNAPHLLMPEHKNKFEVCCVC